MEKYSVSLRVWDFRWLKEFSDGRESIEDEPRSDSKKKKNTKTVRKLVRRFDRSTNSQNEQKKV